LKLAIDIFVSNTGSILSYFYLIIKSFLQELYGKIDKNAEFVKTLDFAGKADRIGTPEP
jgi:hypothetical protein